MRPTPRGWLYNVSGWEAVEITLASGKRLRLGTDEPQRLARALRAAVGEGENECSPGGKSGEGGG